MKIDIPERGLRSSSLSRLSSIFLIAFLFSSAASAFTVNVKDQNGNALTNGFRWQLEEDRTHNVVPDLLGTQTNPPLALTFFTGHHPVATQGLVTGSSTTTITAANTNNIYDPNKRYFLSILPIQAAQPTVTDYGFSLGGAVIPVGANEPIDVVVSALPIPTAQIKIFVFEDNQPVNGAPDKLESGIDGTNNNFSIIVEDAGGGYGATAGRLQSDAFGHPLGTTYNIDGTVNIIGDGHIKIDAEGFALIENLPPGKYGIQVIPPADSDWIQTSTIEGTPIIDAWVKAKEPAFFAEFGPPGPHVFVGMVHKGKPEDPYLNLTAMPISTPIKGTITNNHLNRPPNFGANSGISFPGCYVGLNDAPIAGKLIKVVKCESADIDNEPKNNFPGPEDVDRNNDGIFDAESTFNLPPLPAGIYQLSIWDSALRMVIAGSKLTVKDTGFCVNPKTPNDPLGAPCDELGELPVFNWFGRFDNVVFYDQNENGVRDEISPGVMEPGLNNMGVTLRHRNGVVYQGNVTDFKGSYTFESVFPFFNWLVAEVDFAFPMKATGATFIADAGGGQVNSDATTSPTHGFVSDGSVLGEAFTHGGELNPQPQCLPNGFDSLNNDCIAGKELVTNTVTNDHYSRTETGVVLTQGIQTFLGMTNYAEWGKRPYYPADIDVFPLGDFPGVGDVDHNANGTLDKAENGGISGVVYYAVTRAEDDPRFAAFEPWEPGVPRVVLNLYADGDTNNIPWGATGDGINCPLGIHLAGAEDVDWNGNGCIDLDDGMIESVNGIAGVQFADVDNYPFEWAPQHQFLEDGVTPTPGWTGVAGPEDVNHTDATDPGMGYTVNFEAGDAIQITASDSWDDSLPVDCQGEVFTSVTANVTVQTDCFDGLRNYNQLRPAVFDGGYAFDSYYANGFDSVNGAVIEGLPAGDYIVESITPPGHKLVKEEDKNVDFGEEYSQNVALLPAECVGDSHVVPKFVSFQSDENAVPVVAGNLLPGIALADGVFSPPYTSVADALVSTPLCDRKKVTLANGQNAATDFAYFTQVPKSAIVLGIILNDLANEFDPNNPNFGEKVAPPWVPVSFRDWTGREIVRVYADEYGAYNALLPSSFTANVASPSGYSPNMMTACMNDAGPIPDPSGLTNPDGSPKMIVDPHFNRQLSQFCYTFQYMPGGITYLDTPVVPVAAFSRNGTFPVDCEFPTQTPGIFSVSREDGTQIGGGPLAQAGDFLKITSAGTVAVPNPLYSGIGSVEPRKINRDYGLGGAVGTAELVKLANPGKGDVVKLSVDQAEGNGGSWSNTAAIGYIELTTVNGAAVKPGEYFLRLKSSTGNANAAETSVTVTLVDDITAPGFDVLHVKPSTVQNAQPIQEALNAAADGALILVEPGVYDEMLLMNKPVKLQGYGPLGVVVNARKSPAEKLRKWRAQLNADQLNNKFCLLDGQFPAVNGNTIEIFGSNEGAGITIMGDCGQSVNQPAWAIGQARVDGISWTGSDSGGGIYVAQNARGLTLSNNRIVGNVGNDGGGILIGNYNLTLNGVTIPSNNQDITLNHNQIIENGAIRGSGAGVSIYPGADNYRITNNYICGNFSQGDGGGIGHQGLSDNGWIQNNKILFNQTFKQASEVNGGGIYIGGILLAGDAGQQLTLGSGSVTIRENLIQGNNSGAGNGGGIRLEFVNGKDVNDSPLVSSAWHNIDILNNMIVNNVSGLAGAVSIKDAVKVQIYNNTIANNDSTATTKLAFVASGLGDLTQPHPAGIVVYEHSALFAQVALNAQAALYLGEARFSNPDINNTIVSRNRSFCWGAIEFDNSGVPTGFGLHLRTDPACGSALSEFHDMAVIPPIDPQTQSPLKLSVKNSYVTDLADVNDLGGSLSAVTLLPIDVLFKQAVPVTDVGQTVNQPEATVPKTAAAFDEAGNFIDVRYGPLTPSGNYHLNGSSGLIDSGSYDTLAKLQINGGGTPVDIDFDFRGSSIPDIGADEGQAGGGGGGIGPIAVIDSDGDGVVDNADNCTLVVNPGQEESDGDIYGDACDADINNDGVTNTSDVLTLLGYMGEPGPKADFDQSGIVDYGDLTYLFGELNTSPGPSGL